MAVALHLVMAGLAQGFHGTAGHAFLAGALRIEEAVFMVIVIRSGGCGETDLRYNGANTNGLSARRNQAVTKAECSQSRCVGCMPFGPVGGETI